MVEDFDRSIDLDPCNADSLLGRGTAHLNQREYEAVAREFSRVIALRPGDAAAYLNRGIALTCQERYEETVADFDRAVEIGPEDAESYCQRRIAHIELGRYPEAIEDLHQAASLDPPASLHGIRTPSRNRTGRRQRCRMIPAQWALGYAHPIATSSPRPSPAG